MNQSEVTVKLGLDTRPFEARLRESEKIAKERLGKQRPDQNVPESWSNIGKLSKQSQEFTKAGNGLGGFVERLKQSNPIVGDFIGKIASMTQTFGPAAAVIAPVVAGIGALKFAMNEAWQLKEKAEALDTTAGFIIKLGRAAFTAGEDIEDGEKSLMKLNILLGKAKDGSDEARKTLEKLGVSPWGKTTEQVALEVGAAFDKIADPVERAALQFEVFGKKGQQATEILRELSGGKVKAPLTSEADLSVLANAQQKWRTFYQGIKDSAKDYVMKGAANVLGGFSALNDIPGTKKPGVIGDPREKELIAATKKEAEALAAAKDDYNKARFESGNLESKHLGQLIEVSKIEVKISKISGETAEKYKLQKSLMEEQKKLRDYEGQMLTAANAKAEKRNAYELQLANLQAARADAQKTLDNAFGDRSKATVGETSGELKYGSNGRAIIPDELLNAVAKTKGRNLTNAEIVDYQKGYEQTFKAGQKISSTELGAHALNLFGKFGEADAATSSALGLRNSAKFLTSSERDPMGAQLKVLSAIEKQITGLYEKATKDGLLIQPRMAGKGGK